MANFVASQLFVAIGEVGQAGKHLNKKASEMLLPSQATVQAAKCNKNTTCVYLKCNKRIAYVLLNMFIVVLIFFFSFSFDCYRLGLQGPPWFVEGPCHVPSLRHSTQGMLRELKCFAH